ncbi:MAG: hypothetical protein QG650_303 [Patescibacteria group bacterium]|nr:hypothetical protein [Patescibacteria group bacterium]
MFRTTASYVKKAIRVLARFWLFLVCFLPTVSLIGSAAEFLVRSGWEFPERTVLAAFFATLTGTAALAVSMRKTLREKWLETFIFVALLASVGFFASNMYDLSVCQKNEADDYACYWIYDALFWSAAILTGLLALLLTHDEIRTQSPEEALPV